jgi:hypothetical protein
MVDLSVLNSIQRLINKLHELSWLMQHQEDLINTQDNLPLIEEATEREPCGSRIIKILIIS